MAKANSKLQREPIEMAPVRSAHETIWNTPIRRDPCGDNIREWTAFSGYRLA